MTGHTRTWQDPPGTDPHRRGPAISGSGGATAGRGESPRDPRPGRGGSLPLALFVLLGLGLAAFAIGLAAGEARRTWQIVLVNFLFWTGLAQAGVVFSAILQITNARWAGPIRRIAEAMAGFLPVSCVIFFALYLGRRDVFAPLENPEPHLATWLDPGFLMLRDGAGLLVLTGVSGLFLYHSLGPDLRARTGIGVAGANDGAGLARGGTGEEAQRQRSRRSLSILAPALLVLYAFVHSLLAYDLVMSLSPGWHSSLFGGYFFMGNLYAGVAAVTVLTVLVRRFRGLEGSIRPERLHDLGKILFGLCLFWTYLFFSQYMVIWYGNIPDETGFLIRRVREAPWSPLAVVVLVACVLLPFVTLLGREAKRRDLGLLLASVPIVLGMWLERYLLVVPSLWQSRDLPLGSLEALITAGFFAAFGLAYCSLLRIRPLGFPGAPSSERADGIQGLPHGTVGIASPSS